MSSMWPCCASSLAPWASTSGKKRPQRTLRCHLGLQALNRHFRVPLVWLAARAVPVEGNPYRPGPCIQISFKECGYDGVPQRRERVYVRERNSLKREKKSSQKSEPPRQVP